MLSEDEFLRKIADQGRTVTLSCDSDLYQQGDIANTLYVVMQGLIIRHHTHPSGKEMIVSKHTRQRNNIIGIEAFLMDDPTYNAKAHAYMDSKVLAIEPQYFSTEPELSAYVLPRIVSGYADIEARLASTAYGDARERIAIYIIEQNQHGVVCDSQPDIARYTGLTRITVNKTLQSLNGNQMGYIDITGGSIRIKNLEGLQKIAYGNGNHFV